MTSYQTTQAMQVDWGVYVPAVAPKLSDSLRSCFLALRYTRNKERVNNQPAMQAAHSLRINLVPIKIRIVWRCAV
jgi:hypothetical protein